MSHPALCTVFALAAVSLMGCDPDEATRLDGELAAQLRDAPRPDACDDAADADVPRDEDDCYDPAGGGEPQYLGPVGAGMWTPNNPNYGGFVPAGGIPNDPTLLVTVNGQVCSSLGICLDNPTGWASVLLSVENGGRTWCEAMRDEAALINTFYVNNGQSGVTGSAVGATSFPTPSSDVLFDVTQIAHLPVAVMATDWEGLGLYGPGGIWDQATDMVTLETVKGGCLLEPFQPAGGGA